MKIVPAIDLIGGKAVRLQKGDYAKMTIYNDSPLSVAKEFHAAGARFLHVVDLDGAKDGNLANFDVIEKIAKNMPKRFAKSINGIYIRYMFHVLHAI